MIKFLKQINKERDKSKNKLQKGFTLVETLVALSIFLISIVGIMAVLANGLTNIGQAKKRMTATFLAQEGIEYIRNIRDTNVLSSNNGWSNFLGEIVDCTSGGCDVFNDNANLVIIPCSSGCSSVFPAFYRKIIITPSSLNLGEVKVFSTVSWDQGGSNKSIILSESLFDWVE